MNNALNGFQEAVVDRLRSLQDSLHLDEPQVGKDEDVVAAAVVNGLKGGLRERILVILKRRQALVVRLHHVLFVGSNGDTANRTCRHTLRRLFAATEEQLEELEDDQWMLLGVLADNYRRANRTTEDLLAQLVNGSNDWTVWTKAYVDWRDGEVVVDLTVPCDFESLPQGFDDDVLAVLSHASRLIRLEDLVRHRLSSDAPLTPRTVADLAQKFAGIFEVKKTEKTTDRLAPESEEKASALTL